MLRTRITVVYSAMASTIGVSLRSVPVTVAIMMNITTDGIA